MVVNVEQFSADQLIYRGEGNSSLVIAIKSTSQVIRLLKSDAKKLRNANDVLTHLLQHIDFNEHVLPYVIPAHLFASPRLICLDGHQMDLIKSFIKGKRPSFRLDKTLSKGGYALLMADFCSFPKTISHDWIGNSVIAVEIKPKQGFLPDSGVFGMVASDADDMLLRLKSRICRFGLSQFYKLQKHSIRAISTYCPLDLFSGCPSRTLYAIRCLIDNPQNNFRVFLNSHLIYGDQHHSMAASATDSPGKFDQNELVAVLGEFFRAARQKKHFKSNHKKCDPAMDPVTSFGRLLFQVLCTPLGCDDDDDENDRLPEILKKGNRHDYKYVPNVRRELNKLNGTEKYAFFSTFIELFEKFGDDRQPAFSVKKNGYDEANKENHCQPEKDSWCNQLPNYTECLLHRLPKFQNKSRADFECHCNDDLSDKPVSHSLPGGSVLDSILRAQKLDTIDSLIAVQILERLYGKYRDMKQLLVRTAKDDDADQFRKFLEKFILQNIHDLDQLWHFLLSLTAKDCSIMIAIAKNPTVIPDSEHCPSSTIDLADMLTTDYRYVAKVSIIDLDYKPACKIQRTLHNDRRMINAFLQLNNNY